MPQVRAGLYGGIDYIDEAGLRLIGVELVVLEGRSLNGSNLMLTIPDNWSYRGGQLFDDLERLRAEVRHKRVKSTEVQWLLPVCRFRVRTRISRSKCRIVTSVLDATQSPFVAVRQTTRDLPHRVLAESAAYEEYGKSVLWLARQGYSDIFDHLKYWDDPPLRIAE